MQLDDFGQTSQEIVEKFKEFNEAAWHPDVIEQKLTSPGGLGIDVTGFCQPISDPCQLVT